MTELTFPVIEVFGPTLQGEGRHIGLRTVFIRLGLCDGDGHGSWCTWCDSMFAVDPVQVKTTARYMTIDEIIQRTWAVLDGSQVEDVVISGGNPLVHAHIGELIVALKKYYHVHVETQGTIFRECLKDAAFVIVSPKPPSSQLVPSWKSWARFRGELPEETTVWKVVVFDKTDIKFALELDWKFLLHDLYLSVGTYPTDRVEDILERYRTLVRIVHEQAWFSRVTILPQMHVLLYGHVRGV